MNLKTSNINTTAFYYIALVFCLPLFLNACGSTSVNKKHLLIETNQDKPAANVYFIRPFTYRERGIADNPVKIELNRKTLIKLGKGEYTLIRLKTSDATITTRSYSMFTNKLLPVEMKRSANMTFTEGETYYIHIRQVNEEFRGVYYLPELVGPKTAKRLAAGLSATGAASSDHFEKL